MALPSISRDVSPARLRRPAYDAAASVFDVRHAILLCDGVDMLWITGNVWRQRAW